METNFMKKLAKETSRAETDSFLSDPIDSQKIGKYITDSVALSVRRGWMSCSTAKRLVQTANQLVINQCMTMTRAIYCVNKLIRENSNQAYSSLLSSKKPSLKVQEDESFDKGYEADGENNETDERGRKVSKSFKNDSGEKGGKQTGASLVGTPDIALPDHSEEQRDSIPEMVRKAEKRAGDSEAPIDIKIAKLSVDGDAML